MGRILIGLLLALMLGATSAQAASLKIVSQSQVANGRQFVVRSQKAGRDFRVQVSAPAAGSRRWAPAVYVLDGDSNFSRTSAVTRELAKAGAASPAYVVAVGYPEGVRADEARLHDLVHVTAPYRGAEIGGGGAAFEAFLLQELRPFLESRYRIDRRRSVLVGHSVGGLFTATLMLKSPRAFGGYVIASPSLQFDPDLIARAKAARGGGRWVYVAVGGEEGAVVEFAEQLAAALSRPGSGFLTRQATLPGATHMSMIPAMLPRALGFVLPAAKK